MSDIELLSLPFPFSVHIHSNVLASVNALDKERPLCSLHAREQADGKERKSLSFLHDHISMYHWSPKECSHENKQTYIRTSRQTH